MHIEHRHAGAPRRALVCVALLAFGAACNSAPQQPQIIQSPRIPPADPFRPWCTEGTELVWDARTLRDAAIDVTARYPHATPAGLTLSEAAPEPQHAHASPIPQGQRIYSRFAHAVNLSEGASALTAEPRFYACAARNPCPAGTDPVIEREVSHRCGTGLGCVRVLPPSDTNNTRHLIYMTPDHAQQLSAEAQRAGHDPGAAIDQSARLLLSESVATPRWSAQAQSHRALMRQMGCPAMEVVSLLAW